MGGAAGDIWAIWGVSCGRWTGWGLRLGRLDRGGFLLLESVALSVKSSAAYIFLCLTGLDLRMLLVTVARSSTG